MYCAPTIGARIEYAGEFDLDALRRFHEIADQTASRLGAPWPDYLVTCLKSSSARWSGCVAAATDEAEAEAAARRVFHVETLRGLAILAHDPTAKVLTPGPSGGAPREALSSALQTLFSSYRAVSPRKIKRAARQGRVWVQASLAGYVRSVAEPVEPTPLPERPMVSSASMQAWAQAASQVG